MLWTPSELLTVKEMTDHQCVLWKSTAVCMLVWKCHENPGISCSRQHLHVHTCVCVCVSPWSHPAFRECMWVPRPARSCSGGSTPAPPRTLRSAAAAALKASEEDFLWCGKPPQSWNHCTRDKRPAAWHCVWECVWVFNRSSLSLRVNRFRSRQEKIRGKDA